MASKAARAALPPSEAPGPKRGGGSSSFRTVLVLGIVAAAAVGGYLAASTPFTQPMTINPNGGYDITPIQAPILSGLPLKIFTAALRVPLLGTFLLSKITNDNKFYELLNFAAGVEHPSPLFIPYKLPSRQDFIDLADSYTMAELKIEAARKAKNETAPVLGAEEHLTNSRFIELHDLYKSQKLSPVDVVKEVFRAIIKSNTETQPKFNAFIRYREGQALKEAEASAARFKRGTPASLMDGIPVGVKIEFAVEGQPYTLGTQVRTQIAKHDEEPVARLRKAGAIIVGLTNMQEIGIGTVGFNQFYGVTRNPFNLSHHTGGSSSGSASAVAAGLVPMALAADGGGSVRIPAGLCGVVGLKPTAERVPCGSEIAWSVGVAGPITETVDDLRIALGIIGLGFGSMPQPTVSYRGYPSKNFKGMKVGVFDEYNAASDVQMQSATQKTIAYLVEQGAEVVAIKIPHLQAMFHGHVVSILSEMAASTLPYDSRLSEFGYTTEINLRLARHLSAAHYVSAQIARRWFFDYIRKVFETVDIIVTPNTATPAPRIANDVTGETNLQVTAELMRYMFLANFLGIPAVTIPVGLTTYGGVDVPAGLPVAVQLMGPHWSEPRLLRIAKAIQGRFPMPKPPLYFGPAYDPKKIMGKH